VDQISVVCDAVNDTLTIISRNQMDVVPETSASSTWGIVALVVLLMSAFVILQYRNHASREVLGA
jgi:hypothetical protein